MRATQGTDAGYVAPVVEDYGDLVELTSSHHAATIHGFQTVLGLMSFSGGGAGGGNSGGGLVDNGGQGGSAPGGLGDTGSGVDPFQASSDPATTGAGGTSGSAVAHGVAGVSASHGHAAAISLGSSAKPKGKLPFTGFALVIETLASMATISIGLLLRRFSRRRAELPADEAGPPAPA